MYHALCRTTHIFTWITTFLWTNTTHIIFFVVRTPATHSFSLRFYFFGCSLLDRSFCPHSVYHRAHSTSVHFPLSINLYVKACILITCVRLPPILQPLQRNTKFITLIWFSFIFIENKCFENFFFFFSFTFFHKKSEKEKKNRLIGYTISEFKDTNAHTKTNEEGK